MPLRRCACSKIRLGVGLEFWLRQLLGKQLRATADDRQGVVHFMGGARRHFADGDHRAAAKNLRLSRLKRAIGFGQLLSQQTGLVSNLRRSQGQRPTRRQCGNFMAFACEPLRFAGLGAPDHAADALTVGLQ